MKRFKTLARLFAFAAAVGLVLAFAAAQAQQVDEAPDEIDDLDEEEPVGEDIEPEDVTAEDRIPIFTDDIPEAPPSIRGPDLGGDDTVIVVAPGGGAVIPPRAAAAPQPFYYSMPEGPPVSPLFEASRAAGGPEPEVERAREPGVATEPEVPLGSFYCEGQVESVELETELARLRELEQNARGETKARLSKAIARLEEAESLVARKARELSEAVQYAENAADRAIDRAVEAEPVARPSS